MPRTEIFMQYTMGAHHNPQELIGKYLDREGTRKIDAITLTETRIKFYDKNGGTFGIGPDNPVLIYEDVPDPDWYNADLFVGFEKASNERHAFWKSGEKSSGNALYKSTVSLALLTIDEIEAHFHKFTAQVIPKGDESE